MLAYWIVGAVIAIAVLALLFSRRGSGHPTFKPLEVSSRTERSAEEFQRAFYAELGDSAVGAIRDVLESVSKATGLPAGRLEPADELGAIAAANGLQRAFLVAHLVNEFPEAAGEIMQKTAAGEFVYLHHAIALVVNARHHARVQGA